MKKLFLLILIFQNLIFNAQDHIKPINFDNYSPLWQHLVVDSTRLDDTINNGTKHLINWGKTLIVGDSIGYFVYIDQTKNLQGAYIEKINFKTGALLWHNVFNIETSGEREYPSSVYLNDNGNLEILCFRNIQESFISLWTKAQISIRKYNSNNGELLSHNYNHNNLTTDEELLFFPGKANIFPAPSKSYYYCTKDIGGSSTIYALKEFNQDANLIQIDSLERYTKYPFGTSQSWIKYRRDTLIQARHMHMQNPLKPFIQENYDTFEFWVDLYSSTFDSLNSYNLSNDLPYNWSIILNYDKAGYLKIISQDSIYVDNDYTAFVYFDMQGNYYETLDYGKNLPANILSAKLPNQDGFLLINRVIDSDINNKRIIEISKSDGQGNIELIKTLSFEGGRYFSIQALDILKNNTILLGLALWVPDPDKAGTSISKILIIVAIDGNELGLVNTQNEITKIDDIIIYPNPAKDIITIEFPSIFSGSIDIIDILGSKIKTGFIKNQHKQNIDVSSIRSGVYFIRAKDEKNIIGYKYSCFVVK